MKISTRLQHTIGSGCLITALSACNGTGMPPAANSARTAVRMPVQRTLHGALVYVSDNLGSFVDVFSKNGTLLLNIALALLLIIVLVLALITAFAPRRNTNVERTVAVTRGPRSGAPERSPSARSWCRSSSPSATGHDANPASPSA